MLDAAPSDMKSISYDARCVCFLHALALIFHTDSVHWAIARDAVNGGACNTLIAPRLTLIIHVISIVIMSFFYSLFKLLTGLLHAPPFTASRAGWYYY